MIYTYISMYTQRAKPWITTTVNISPEFYKLCKENHIKFSEAMRVGISIVLAERGIIPYDNNLNILRKVQQLENEIAEKIDKIVVLKKENEGKNTE